jgi:hypothetical protein
MKVNKKKFDNTLEKLLKAKPVPRDEVKTKGKHGSRKPIITPPPAKEQ